MCQFHQHFMSSFCGSVLRIFYMLTVWVCNFLAEGKYRKSCLYNIGQIDPMRAIVVKKDTLDGEVILATFF